MILNQEQPGGDAAVLGHAVTYARAGSADPVRVARYRRFNTFLTFPAPRKAVVTHWPARSAMDGGSTAGGTGAPPRPTEAATSMTNSAPAPPGTGSTQI